MEMKVDTEIQETKLEANIARKEIHTKAWSDAYFR
jgi:hypothetical protein